MGWIWEEENKFKVWLEIEIYACEAQAQLGTIPHDSVKLIREKAAFEINRIDEIEKEVKHDVIAFLTNVGEFIGEESRYVHLGMTSSDVLDTSLAVQMKQSAELLLDGLKNLKNVLAKRGREFKKTIMVGRTHGVHAEPTTFGLKLALWYAEAVRNIERLTAAKDRISVGQISGAVGTYTHLDPSVEQYVCKKLGLQPAPISTQVLQRDRHAEFLNTLALIGSSLEKISTEIRHLQRTEILEVEEHFSKEQKGSSSMPHKRNPITSERIAGLSRVLRGNAVAAMENVSLWHERDITHSSVERIIIPDSCILLDFMLAEAIDLIENLVVYPKNMENNLWKTHGLIFSQSVLLALTKKNVSREEAYKIVQSIAMEVWEKGGDFKQKLSEDKQVQKYLASTELDDLFDISKHLKHVDYVFKKLGID